MHEVRSGWRRVLRYVRVRPLSPTQLFKSADTPYSSLFARRSWTKPPPAHLVDHVLPNASGPAEAAEIEKDKDASPELSGGGVGSVSAAVAAAATVVVIALCVAI